VFTRCAKNVEPILLSLHFVLKRVDKNKVGFVRLQCHTSIPGYFVCSIISYQTFFVCPLPTIGGASHMYSSGPSSCPYVCHLNLSVRQHVFRVPWCLCT